MRIGEQVRKFREQKKLSLTELAHASGIQIATLSRIENNKMTGTLESHLAIAKAMGIELTDLYLNLQQEEPVSAHVDDATAEPLPVSDGKCSLEILARQVASKKMLPALIKIEPRSSTAVEILPAGGERFVYVLEGTVEIKLKSQVIQLSSNTSLYFNANQPHNIENNTDLPARIISVSTPVVI